MIVSTYNRWRFYLNNPRTIGGALTYDWWRTIVQLVAQPYILFLYLFLYINKTYSYPALTVNNFKNT